MVKKAKPAKADAEKKSKKVKDTSNEQHTVKAGLMGIMLPAMVGSALVTAVCGALLLLLVIMPGAEKQMAILGTAQAEHFVNDLTQLGQSYQASVQQMADSALVRDALSNGVNVEQREQELQALFPAASSVHIFKKGKAQKDASSVPPISFAQLDMVAKSDKKNNAVPEIHQHDNRSYLTIVKAVRSGEKIIGSLLVSFELDALKASLPELKAEQGYVEVIQTFSNKPQVMYTSGNPQHKTGPGYEAKGQVPHWSARFFPAASTNIIASGSTTAWILVAVSVILVLALSGTSYFLLNRSLQSNAMALAAFLQAQLQKGKSDKPFTLGIFASLAQTLGRLLSDYETKVARQLDKAKAAAAANPASGKGAMPDFEPNYRNDDVLDMDMDLDGDDHDLLSAAAEIDDSPLQLEDVQVAEPQMASIDVSVAPEIFRAYDIRGIVGDTLDQDVAYALGAAIASEAKEAGQEAILVARDGRHSSQELAESLADGIQSTGCDVIDLGMVPTPVLYYATKTQRTQSGVMVTGSHNPPEYNGFKIVINDETLAQDRIQALRKRLDKGKLVKGQGRYEAMDVVPEYMERICSDVVLAKPMKVVVDTGNGVAGPLTNQLLEALGCMVTPLFADVDGDFPNHHPDPSAPANLQDLIRTVQAEGAELGLALDGDGDRLGLVTQSGKIIWPDRMLMLYARDLLARNPGADILYDVKCSRDVAELVSNLGGRAIMCATGHSLMKAKMKETGAVVGGELSGHIFFNDRWYGFDDAIYSAARMLEILSMEPFESDQVFAEFPEKVSTPELHIQVSDANKFKIMEKLESQGNFEGGNLVKVDGVRVDFPDSWGLIRASNTTPVLVARFEGDTEAALETVKSVFREQLLAVEPSLNISF
ncbi:MAG: phosphomannomutase/phosphoglucomutase [Pseudomonadota bacterium]|nr:phosphomannomutase/phosphoglucomutase [Pseudomonadota bacterium]